MTFSKKLKLFPASLILAVLLASSCNSKKTIESNKSDEDTIYQESTEYTGPDYDEVWMMQGWTGYMGVFIGLRGDEFDYIFYSDTGKPIYTPYTGKYLRDEDTLTLVIENPNTEVFFYSKEWKFVKEGVELRLVATSDIKRINDTSRWLRKVNLDAYKYLYDPNDPFILIYNGHIEDDFERRTNIDKEKSEHNISENDKTK